jgi:hypothetical protein
VLSQLPSIRSVGEPLGRPSYKRGSFSVTCRLWSSSPTIADMEDNLSDVKPGMGADVFATATTPASADPATPSAPDQRASPALSSASSSARRPYVPQFSAATQMILSRINNNPGGLSAALSSASSVARSIEKSTYEDAKRRLVMNMNTSLTMSIPPLPPRRATGSSARALTMSMGDAFQLRTPAPISTPSTAKPPPPVKPAVSKPTPPKPKGKAARGTKRKRGKDDEDTSSSLSELSDSDVDAAAASKKAATKTKSGRHVQKPTQFNPTDTPGSQKRKNYGKRTAEQALCKVCTRGLSPIANQIVFCDGCNNCWHQLCHDPYIDDEFVTDENRSWFCGSCATKREKALAKKKTLVEHKGVSWASKTPAQVTRTSATQILYYIAMLTEYIETNISHQPPARSTGQHHHVQHRATSRPSHLPRPGTGDVYQTGSARIAGRLLYIFALSPT